MGIKEPLKITDYIKMKYKPVEPEYNFKCKKCQSLNLLYAEIDDVYDVYEDIRYYCNDCDYTWVAEGSDY